MRIIESHWRSAGLASLHSNAMKSAAASTENTPTVRVNGESVDLTPGATVSVLLDQLALPADRVAVEMDREIVRRADWDATEIRAGAKFEIVHFVGGG